jgi:hypothetical protein
MNDESIAMGSAPLIESKPVRQVRPTAEPHEQKRQSTSHQRPRVKASIKAVARWNLQLLEKLNSSGGLSSAK